MSLPSSAADFVGRERELDEIARLLADPTCHLLTLVGPGGIGKTRLALEAARALPSVYFVPLQPLTAAELIVSAIAEAVGFQFYSGADPKQQLLDHLCEKSLVLVLDNFEHLLDGAGLIAEMLAAAPKLRLLVTSRERLNLTEEWVLEIGGLAYPQADTEVEGYSAYELFNQHARRVKAGFAFTDKDRAAVVRICHLVDGMPLALELAVSWLRVLSCEAIADEIAHSLDILETPARNIELRHRTMRATFAPTWERLTDHERDVFMRLSTFRGGFTREAAKDVAGASLRTLSSLLDKSLLRVDANGRYDVHELLRQYAAEKLTDAGAVDAAAQSHVDYFLKFAEQVEAHNFGRNHIDWYDRTGLEFDNLRAALIQTVATETGLRIAIALGWFFGERNHWIEGLGWLTHLLEVNPDAPTALRAKALYNAGALAVMQGDPRARALCEAALALARVADDRQTSAWSLSELGFLVGDDAYDLQQAAAFLEESLTLFRETDDLRGLSHTLYRRAYRALDMKDYAYVRLLVEELVSRTRSADDKFITAWILYLQGRLAWLDSDLEQVKAYYERSLSYFREAQIHDGVHMSIVNLAGVEQTMGNIERARMLNEEALILHRESLLNHPRMPFIFTGLAGIARIYGQLERAGRLLGAANSSWLMQFANLHPEITPFESEVAVVRTQLGEAAFAVAWAAGKAMTREQATAYALEGRPNSIEAMSVKHPDAADAQRNSLSVREVEILRLVAEGLSNGEIAEQLALAKSTIKWYVRQIFSKLDATSRTQAVARARSLELFH